MAEVLEGTFLENIDNTYSTCFKMYYIAQRNKRGPGVCLYRASGGLLNVLR